jgi:hypothetical protein
MAMELLVPPPPDPELLVPPPPDPDWRNWEAVTRGELQLGQLSGQLAVAAINFSFQIIWPDGPGVGECPSYQHHILL